MTAQAHYTGAKHVKNVKKAGSGNKKIFFVLLISRGVNPRLFSILLLLQVLSLLEKKLLEHLSNHPQRRKNPN